MKWFRVSREKTCGKTRYARVKDVRTALNAMAGVRGRRGRAEELRAYPCPKCHGWHLTKQL